MAKPARLFAMALAFGLALGLGTAPGRAEPGASAWASTDQAQVRLVAATPAVGNAAAVQLGLEFRMAPHWDIYWRSPGDAGYPPQLDWTGSENLEDWDMAWPAPRRFSFQGLETVGYTDHVVFPITARLDHPGAAARFHLAVSFLICNNICVPNEVALTLDLPQTAAGPGDGFAALIGRYAERVPGDGSKWGLAVRNAAIIPGKPAVLALEVASTAPLKAPDTFVEGGSGLGFGAPKLARGEMPGESLLRIPVFGPRAAVDAMIGHPLTVTLVDGERSLEATVTPVPGQQPPDFAHLLQILAYAVLGGFILNFMPCVLPVLSIKLLSAIEQSGRPRLQVRLGFLATAFGVVLSMLALAAVLVALKSAGLAIGWGVQFQQPLFLIAMVALVTLFACNLAGFFEVPLPHWIASLSLPGEREYPVIGNIATGIFATLLATPCSAPFLGTAVGFALAAGPTEILAVFLALGLGLAAPYLLVALIPALAQLLPRPGRWMVMLRRVLALPLAATALWLLWVLSAQIGLAGALLVALAMAALSLVLALLHAPVARRVAPAALIAAALLVPVLHAAPPASAASDALWRGFDRAEIDRLVRAGRVVFVDVTADWCLTCKLNKELVIDTPAIRARLTAPGVVAMRADWTRPSDTIAAYLHSFGRYGIPFNAVYGPGAPRGIPLSELLTAGDVTAALAEAARPGPVAGASR